MRKYLGETLVTDLTDTKFAGWTEQDWAFYWLEMYGGFGGSHHKAWAIDQAMRILKGTPVEVKIARWAGGREEYRVNLLEPSQEYLEWVKETEEAGYEVDEGIAP